MTVPGAFPEFLHAHGKLGRLAVPRQAALPQQLLGQVPAHAVGEDRDLRVDVGAGLEHAPWLAVLADAAVARAHANHAITVEQHRLSGKTPEQVDAFGLDLSGQPPRELVQRNDVVAMILERRRRQWQRQLLPGREEVDVVGLDLARQRRALGHKVGHEIG